MPPQAEQLLLTSCGISAKEPKPQAQMKNIGSRPSLPRSTWQHMAAQNAEN